MYFQDLLYRCHVFCVYAGYDFEIFEAVYHHYTSEHSETLLEARVFCDSRFVLARNMGCRSLGRSIHEVLQTVICALAGTTFCPDLCGCADGDLDRETSTSLPWLWTLQANAVCVNWVSATQKKSEICRQSEARAAAARIRAFNLGEICRLREATAAAELEFFRGAIL